jgi:RNA polymerase sigma-70 factor (ECF subfamily)
VIVVIVARMPGCVASRRAGTTSQDASHVPGRPLVMTPTIDQPDPHGARPARQRRRAGRAPHWIEAPDPSVVAAFRRRDPGAVRALYRLYGRLVYAVAHRMLGQSDLAAEATQQTFVQAWQAADRLDAERDPAPWLTTIARRAAIDIHRRESRQTASALDDVATDHPAVVSLPPDLATLDAVWRVRRAIDALPPEERIVTRLQHLDGMTHREIAAALGIALGTVKSRSHRAHARLAALLGSLRESVT